MHISILQKIDNFIEYKIAMYYANKIIKEIEKEDERNRYKRISRKYRLQ